MEPAAEPHGWEGSNRCGLRVHEDRVSEGLKPDESSASFPGFSRQKPISFVTFDAGMIPTERRN